MDSFIDTSAAVAGGVIATEIIEKEKANGGITIVRHKVKYHSFLLWILFGWVVLWIPCIYYFFSDKHQFRFL